MAELDVFPGQELSYEMDTPPSPERFYNAITAYQKSAAIQTAIDLDLFTAIGEGKDTAASIAERCAASERGVRTLCDFLTIEGFLTKSDGRYGLSPDAAVFLDRHSPAYMGGITELFFDLFITNGFKDLTACVKKGGTLLPGAGTVVDDHPLWRTFARAMMPMVRMPAEQIASMVDGIDGSNSRLLDIAAGHGLFGIAFARRHPNLKVVAVDWPKVLEVARENAEDAGITDRYTLLPGSAFEVEFGDGYNLALLTNFLHHFDPATCEMLLAKVHRSLAAGGKAVVLEMIPDEDRISPPIPAAFSMTMLVSTQNGDAYTYQELDSMFRRAGFSTSECHPVPFSPQRIVVAVK